MDLRRLQTFVTVAELGTVSNAALRLRISQSALSRRIGELEREFDLKLFDRISSAVCGAVTTAKSGSRPVTAKRRICAPTLA